ncbi:SRPBCC family protein [Falsirhodobacter xinxiangensis]|uniref:SRPBCC family protein n=1 Tax=Falsirhodobacter xinxiangensis TaxID=2530049 RepID=UPI0010AA9020|nr:SRPBCC family protein [Rhodobacter xinxiangensis]
MRLFTLALAATTLIAGMAEAHGPSRQKTTQDVVLNATPDEVWQAVGDFGDLSWMPGVASVDAPQGNEKDGTRTVTLDSGTVLTEELTKYDPEKRTMSFRMTKDDIEAIPVTNFSTVLTVKDDGGKALVEMRGGFYRGFPNNDPPPDLNDDAAVAAVNAHYRAALDGLAERFGQ